MSPVPVFKVTPLTPRPRLLVLSLAVFAVWVGALLWMYFATVYPMRHTQSALTATTRPN